MADDRRYITAKQDSRLDELLAWHENVGRFIHTPYYRRRQFGAPADRRYTGQLTAAMSTGSTSASVDNIETIIGPDIVSSSTETKTVANFHGWEGDNNGKCRFEWNRSSSQFEFYALDCPST